MSPGERLKNARTMLGKSVEQMADVLGLRGANAGDDVRKWERGAREPSGVVLVAAEALAALCDLAEDAEQLLEFYPHQEGVYADNARHSIARARALIGVQP